jgi:hypothetical protein
LLGQLKRDWLSRSFQSLAEVLTLCLCRNKAIFTFRHVPFAYRKHSASGRSETGIFSALALKNRRPNDPTANSIPKGLSVGGIFTHQCQWPERNRTLLTAGIGGTT